MTLANYLNSQFTLIQYGELLLRIVVAIICGAFIGYERSKRFKEAGIRTHMIVCVASCLLMIVSKYGFADTFNGAGNADPARIAAQVVSGISFLGAGVIFHTKNSVKGLTTAAGIWATAGIGISIGAGLYLLGIFVSVTVFIIQFLMHHYEIGGDAYNTIKIQFVIKDSPELRNAVKEKIKEINCQVIENEIRFDEGDYISYNITVRTNKEFSVEDLMAFLEKHGDVKNVSLISMM